MVLLARFDIVRINTYLLSLFGHLQKNGINQMECFFVFTFMLTNVYCLCDLT